MCLKTKKTMQGSKTKSKETINDVYFELQRPNNDDVDQKTQDIKRCSLIPEEFVFVVTSLGVIFLTHALTWGHWTLPYIYAISTPFLIGIKTIVYWKYKWQYFMLDFCYFSNMLTYLFLWIPSNEFIFRMVFSLSNGPVLVAAVVYRNSLVYHQHDKITSCYIHFLPAILSFSVRWFPAQTSKYWFKPFIQEAPSFNIVWLYLAPFAFYFLHSILYMFVINIILKPKDPYVTSYTYLAEKFDRLNCLGGPCGQAVVYYGLSWLFCLTSMTISLLAYSYFPAHCIILALVTVVVIWNGGSYYVRKFKERGISNME